MTTLSLAITGCAGEREEPGGSIVTTDNVITPEDKTSPPQTTKSIPVAPLPATEPKGPFTDQVSISYAPLPGEITELTLTIIQNYGSTADNITAWV